MIFLISIFNIIRSKLLLKFYRIKLVSCIIDLILTSLNVSISDPFILRTVNTTIKTPDSDFDNLFLVGFNDGQARRYSGDFSSCTILTVP